MLKIFVWIVFIGHVVFADINYTPTVLSTINKYDEDVIILSKKLKKYGKSIKKSMETMRQGIGVIRGKPNIFTFEISEISIKDNIIMTNIALTLARYRATHDGRSFVEILYADYEKVALDIHDEETIKLQLMTSIDNMLKCFKMKYIDDN